MDATPICSALDEWEVVERLLPAGWREQARTLGALRRARNVPDAGVLLRILMVHLADGCSLVETAARAAQLGWCDITPVAVFKRLQAAEQWLRWMAEHLWHTRRSRIVVAGRRVRAMDATAVTESGRTGSEYRIHYALDLADLRCDHFELTDNRTGESLQRLPVQKNDLILGDRGLARAPGIVNVIGRGADVLMRASPRNLPLFERNGRQINTVARLRRLRVGGILDQTACVRGGEKVVCGRMVAIKRSRRATMLARRRVVRKAQKNGDSPPSKRALDSAGYVVIWTSIGRDELTAKRVLELYRLRWQIELTFKRCKSILGLGQLPKHADASSRAWLHGKLLVAMLVEKLIEDADAFSPWGYALEAPEPLA